MDKNFIPPKNQPSLLKTNNEWQKEWTGMPEFVQEKQREFAKIIVRFRNQEDLDEFSKILGQNFTSKTKSAWHPKLHIDKSVVKRYVDDES